MTDRDPESMACRSLELACWKLRYFKGKQPAAEDEKTRREVVEKMGALLHELGLVGPANEVLGNLDEFCRAQEDEEA